MKNPKISVIIPVYNGEKTLRQCLNSVLDQTYNNYEVIVVDNNSTDSTKGIIQEFEKNNKKIKYVFEPEKGRGAARNKGVTQSKGDIIAMTDSDCVVPRNWLEELTKPLRKENEEVVMGFEENLIDNYWGRNIRLANHNFIKKVLHGRYIGHIDTKNFAIKSILIRKLMFDSALMALEDFDLYLRLKKVANIRFIPSLKVKHNYKDSFNHFFKSCFNRGYWAYRIYQKHKKDKDIRKEPMVESISIINFLLFPFWIVLQFIKRSIGESLFVFASEVSWRAGLVCGLIRGRK